MAETHVVKLNGYITRPQLWVLDDECKPLRQTFPDYGPYLVGSVMERPTFRDVDVQLILPSARQFRASTEPGTRQGAIPAPAASASLVLVRAPDQNLGRRL